MSPGQVEPAQREPAAGREVFLRADPVAERDGKHVDGFVPLVFELVAAAHLDSSLIGEDVDLGFRLQLAGYPCLFVPDAIAYHIGSATSGRDSDFSLYYGHRNLVWNYFKNMPLSLLLLTLPMHLALNMLSILLFALRGRGKTISRSKIDALKGLSNILARRNETKRTVGSRYIWTILAKRLRKKFR